MIKRATSRKVDGRYQLKEHVFEPAEHHSGLDAYFGPNGQFFIRFIMDDRLYELSFNEVQSKRMAKRLCVDTLDRAVKLLSKPEEY